MEQFEKDLLEKIAGIRGFQPGTAFNLRYNAQGVERHSTQFVEIRSKETQPGIDIIVKQGAKKEQVHIPVLVSHSGVDDIVYNDFYIEDGADVEIIAGCGIHNDGCHKTKHTGIHTFHVGKHAHVRYVEKHYGEGDGSGANVLDPTTIIHMDEGSYMELDTAQIKGVDSTKRETKCYLKDDAKLMVMERLMTHGKQQAHSDMEVHLNGTNAVLQIVSRSVGKDQSVQVFHPIAVGNAKCRAHVQCDSILMDDAKISSIPEITANHVDAEIIHEAAIGKINNDQLLKLQTFGLEEEEAEKVIVEGFLK